MKVELSEKVVSRLKYIQNHSDTMDEAIRIIEDFVYCMDDGYIDNDNAIRMVNALRNIRLLKNTLSGLYPENN